MRPASIEKLLELQRDPSRIRNICILAHVDHGKTTLADTLVASNGIISQRMAGKLRYLDSREDEQLRGITMKSSAIALQYNSGDGEYLVNVVDSPGHIDFSSEVSTAVRLCDGAVVLVDVVEGVSPQTHAVLRQAWLENIKPVLILNKVDRLIIELKMSTVEAHLHLQQILEQVNAIMAELFTTHVLEQAITKKTREAVEEPPVDQEADEVDQMYDWSSGLENTDDSHLYFSPDQGNVIFSSAIDGWGFSIEHFAKLYAAKLGFKIEVLKKTLWGDFYLEMKTKRIKRGAQLKGKKSLFAQFILDNLWAVYDAVLLNRDPEKTEKIIKSMNLKISARDSRHSDPRVLLQAVTTQWLPLSSAVLAMVVESLPSPLAIEEERVERLICSNAQRFDSLPQATQQLKTDFMACSAAPEAPVVIYVSKMFSVDWKHLPQNKPRVLTAEEMSSRRQNARLRHDEKMAARDNETHNTPTSAPDPEPVAMETISPAERVHEPTDQIFIAFARVFSGTVRRGAKLYVLGPKHDPAQVLEELEDHAGDVSILASQPYISEFTVDDLYLIMGRELEAMEEVPAGNILGLGGLEQLVLKSGTVSSTVVCPAFTDMYMEASPIVRVALEPVHPGDMKRLVEGLRLLNQADPCVKAFTQGTGEHVIMAAGEVHLQKCLDDLKLRYAKVEVNVSSPVVPFRETIIRPPKTDMMNEAIEGQTISQAPDDSSDKTTEYIELQTANKMCTIRVRTLPLPDKVTQILEENTSLIKALGLYALSRAEHATHTQHTARLGYRINQKTLQSLAELRTTLQHEFSAAGECWEEIVDNIWAFGPKRVGPNLLVNRASEYKRPSLWSYLTDDHKVAAAGKLRDFDDSVISGFQMAALSGPLCEEPIRGVCFIMERWDVDKEFSLKVRKISERERKASERQTCERLRSISGMFGEESEEEDSANPTSEDAAEIQTEMIRSSDTEHVSQTEECSTSDSEITSQVSELSVQGERKERHGPFTGQLMSCVKEACRKAFQTQPQRLMVAMYSCVIQANADVLGRLYAVLGKRGGRVTQEDLTEGSSLFTVTATLPVIESFGFAEEIRKKTSGLASPQLRFSHWEVLDVDPFWVPTTEEEYTHYGEKADSENLARKYMDSVRRRKGLKVDDKLVEFAEKQRTLTRNK